MKLSPISAQLPRGVGEFQQNEALLALRGLRWAMASAKGWPILTAKRIGNGQTN